MKAIVLRGKNKGNIIKISQWSNDWFSDEDNNIYSASSLAFNSQTKKKIENSGSLGTMLIVYRFALAPVWTGEYCYKLRKNR